MLPDKHDDEREEDACFRPIVRRHYNLSRFGVAETCGDILRTIYWVLLFFLAAVSASFAATGVVKGVVRDMGGNPIPDAFVTVNTTTVQVGNDGVYSFNVTIPGTVTMWADGLGYARRVFSPLSLSESDSLTNRDLVLLSAEEPLGYNWDFEVPGATNTGADGWEILQYPNGIYSWSPAENHTPGGKASVFIRPSGSGTWGAIAQTSDHWPAASSNNTYSAWYYIKGNGIGTTMMYIEFYDATKTSMVLRLRGTQTAVTNDWQRVTCATNVGVHHATAYARIQLYQSSTSSNSYIDDVKWDVFEKSISGNSISGAKNGGDSATITLTDKSVSAVGGALPEGVIYIEEDPERSSGIRVEGVTTAVERGSTVAVTGVMGTTDGGERKITATTVTPTEGSPVGTLGAAGKDLKDNLMIVGLYVRAWGRVTPDSGSSYFIDDSSGPIKVIGTPPAGDYAVINAVVSYDNGVQLIAVP